MVGIETSNKYFAFTVLLQPYKHVYYNMKAQTSYF